MYPCDKFLKDNTITNNCLITSDSPFLAPSGDAAAAAALAESANCCWTVAAPKGLPPLLLPSPLLLLPLLLLLLLLGLLFSYKILLHVKF